MKTKSAIAKIIVIAFIIVVLITIIFGTKPEKSTSYKRKVKTTTTTLATTTTTQKTTVNENIADENYFNDAIFLGNSVLDEMHKNTNLKGYYYTAVNLMVNTVFEREFVNYGGSKITAINAIKNNNNFSKVYIMFGTNELGWVYPETFIKDYKKIIKVIKEKNPKAVIYVMSIMPVTASHSKESKDENNQNIDKFNNYIKKMTEQENLIYLDLKQGLCSESGGVLPENATFDGVHPGKAFCEKWVNYLKTNIKKG